MYDHRNGSALRQVYDHRNGSALRQVYDHRNGSALRMWLVDSMLLGKTGGGDPSVYGFYIDDDGWTAAGPSEMESNATAGGEIIDFRLTNVEFLLKNDEFLLKTNGFITKAMGLSAVDVAEMVTAWQMNVNAWERAVYDKGLMIWWFMCLLCQYWFLRKKKETHDVLLKITQKCPDINIWSRYGSQRWNDPVSSRGNCWPPGWNRTHPRATCHSYMRTNCGACFSIVLCCFMLFSIVSCCFRIYRFMLSFYRCTRMLFLY